MNHPSDRLMLSLFFILGASASAFGKVSTDIFQGRVSDPQERVVAGAEVRIVDQATGIVAKLVALPLPRHSPKAFDTPSPPLIAQ